MKAVMRVLTAIIFMAISLPVAAQQAPLAPQVRQLTVDDAVRLALENNLGIRVARIDPQIQDLSVALARAAWIPSLTTTVQKASTESPANSFLSGGQSITNGR